MKQTKEKIININEIFQIQSPQDAREFERIAKGRKFCKIGDRIGDICDEELERYYYENSRNIFVRIFKEVLLFALYFSFADMKPAQAIEFSILLFILFVKKYSFV